MMEVMVLTAGTRHAKLQSNCHHQQTNIQLVTGQMPLQRWETVVNERASGSVILVNYNYN